MSIKQVSKIAEGYEPIAGYTLEQKLGEGGFGEVWRANAPGGLKKAVKFVFGATDERRGNRELKSLERIKGVHHPFLLTLERFEIVDDRLVIVTELADGSLEDVLKRHIDRGSCGIPRNALLAYLNDAADALDYLHGNYQLQHLDVKPGNLLMVGGHVKVGDFGLLKDLRDTDQSIVSGLTPIYAPPELFDGRPAINSDQYSLAVMYQELLTGTRPFAGRTIAQLATQHIHAAPNLDPLPPVDRIAVARALEKDPTRRFDSCKEFVEALRSPNGDNPRVVLRAPITNATAIQAKVEDLPQLEADSRLLRSRVTGHALVVAIGGFGADTLYELRGRVANLHSACPLDLHSVLIDTDMETLHAARLMEVSDRTPPTTIVHVPLRSPQEYRSGSAVRFKSLSRRWIYNVPRSGTTEGMRPLGRLAMVDHSAKIDAALRESIDHLAAVCGERIPSVYVIGSLSGGTASGMLMDLLPRVRQLLDQAGLQSARVLPLLSTVMMQGNPRQPVTLLDTHAAIAEIGHFLTAGNSYPGDAGINWETLPAALSPLRDAYVIVDGDPGQNESPSAVATVIDYMWSDATGAGDLLAKARQMTDATMETIGRPMLRSVGVSRLRCLRVLEENLLAPAAARHLLLRWLGRPAESRQLADPLLERLKKRCGYSPSELTDVVKAKFGTSNEFIVDRLTNLTASVASSSGLDAEVIDRLLMTSLTDTDIESDLSRRVATMLVLLRRELSTRFIDARLDLTTALLALQRFQIQCDELADAMQQSVGQSKVSTPTPLSANEPLTQQMEHATRLATERLEVIAARIAIPHLRRMSASLGEMSKMFDRMIVDVAQAIRCVPGDKHDTENPWDEMPAAIQIRFPAVLDHLHGQAVQTWIVANFQDNAPPLDTPALVADLIAKCLPVVEDLVDRQKHRAAPASDSTGVGDYATLTQPAMTLKASGLSTRTSATLTRTAGPMETQTFDPQTCQRNRFNEQSTIESALQAATPSLLQCGGRQRLLLIIGNEDEREQLESQVLAHHQGSLTTVVLAGSSPMLIHEAQAIPIDQILRKLELVSGADTQLCRRLHARTDIEWASL